MNNGGTIIRGRRSVSGVPSVGPRSGSGSSAQVVPVPPGFPWFWFDARNINLIGNFGVANLSAMATYKNLGIGGATYDLAQATGANQPIWHQLGSQGRINNLPSVFFDGVAQSMQSAAGAARSIPHKVGMIYRMNNADAAHALFDGVANGARSGAYIAANTGSFHLTGGGDADTGLIPALGMYHSIVCHFATGAASYVVLDGVQSALFNPVAQALTGLTFNGLIGPIFLSPMDCPIIAGWDLLTTVNNGLTDLAIDNWLWATWGAMQQ